MKKILLLPLLALPLGACGAVLGSEFGEIAIKESAERVEDYCENKPADENRQLVVDAINAELAGQYTVFPFDCSGDGNPDF